VQDSYLGQRITVVIDHILGNQETLFAQTKGRGWQQPRSILAIGSGGLFGQGYLKGIQTQSPYETSLNARFTDEIFAVCGEELGFIGCLVIIVLLCAIIFRCVWVARRAPSPMSSLVAMGFAGMLLFQSVLNIGMCLYVLPIVGLTLPFFSYGGSSIITMFAAMGVVSSIKTRSLPSWLKDRYQK
ncbi:MAG: FtsW/RodA/SpoVE family cell cycle protein, partial [Oscillospiraceae bacterium]|nr:FtsW/RodA/SpoVE family cell cycle protein [Oscillospiraceae bacterium]